MLDVINSTDHFIARAERVSSNSPQWLLPARTTALERFKSQGWPSKRHEDWRFTSLKAITNAAFGEAPSVDQLDLTPYILEQDSIVLVFVNGQFRQDLSRQQETGEGLLLMSLADAIESPQHAPQVANHLGKYVKDAVFTSLNTALAEQGVFLHLKAGTCLEPLLEILHLNEGEGLTFDTQARHLMLVDEKSRLRVVETFVSNTASFSNTVLEMNIAKGAQVEHYLREHSDESASHVHTLAASLGDQSKLESHSLLTGGSMVRNNLDLVFQGEAADAYVSGLFVGHGDQILDNHIYMDHAKGHNTSNQFFKGILDGRARGVLTGRVVVRADAQKTDSCQTNRNLLLSDQARVDTQPQLEIYADDVKCAHGATTGQLDEDALFYFQARGVAPDKARDLLLYAFANEVIARFPLDSLRLAAETFLMERFETSRLLGDSYE